MKFTSVVLTGAVGAGVVASAVAFAGAAAAKPGDCTAAEFARTVSTVSGQTADYLNNHQDVNTGLTNAIKGAEDKHEAAKAYLETNPSAKADLERIRQPIKDLKGRCDSAPATPAPAAPAAVAPQGDQNQAEPAAWNPFAPAAEQPQAEAAEPQAAVPAKAPATPASQNVAALLSEQEA